MPGQVPPSIVEVFMVRRILGPLLLLLSPALLRAQHDPCREMWGDDDQARVCQTRPLGAKGLRALRVDPGANGGAEVDAWDRDSVAVEAKVLSYARNDSDADALNRQVTVTLTNGVLSADGPATRRSEGWAVIFVLHVPRRIDLDIETTNGPVDVADVAGTLHLTTVNGPVTLDRVGGDVRARLQNGPLTITLAGTSWDGAGLDAETVNGPLTLRIPDGYNAQLETGTQNGPFHTDVPITVQGNIGRIGQRVSTTLGRGGKTLRAVTTNGPLTITTGR